MEYDPGSTPMDEQPSQIKNAEALANTLDFLRGLMMVSLGSKLGYAANEYAGATPPKTEPEFWQQHSQLVSSQLLNARQFAVEAQALLDSSLPETGVGYLAVTLIDDLSRKWLPLLNPRPVTETQAKVLVGLHERLEDIAARTRHAPTFLASTSGNADAEQTGLALEAEVPLTDRERAVLQMLFELKAGKGLVGSQIVRELNFQRDFSMSQTALTSQVVLKLRGNGWDVKNGGGARGYYLSEADRLRFARIVEQEEEGEE